MLLTTAVRFVDILYLLSRDNTNLPVPVIIVTSIMVLYGVFLTVKKFISNIRMKQLFIFYMIQSAMIVFNLIFTSVASPLRINAMETIIVGTFLDLIVNAGLIYMMFRQMRSVYTPSMHGAAVRER